MNFTERITAWDNSGDSRERNICREYAISDTNGHFAFPSFSGLKGFSYYRFGTTPSVSGPSFDLIGFSYKMVRPTKERDRDDHIFYVEPWDFDKSLNHFRQYLDGEKALKFREVDHPFLEKIKAMERNRKHSHPIIFQEKSAGLGDFALPQDGDEK